MSASRGEWSLDELGMISPPQSPRVHPRSRAEGALGDNRGKKIIITSAMVYPFTHALKAQAAPATGSRASSLHKNQHPFFPRVSMLYGIIAGIRRVS